MFRSTQRVEPARPTVLLGGLDVGDRMLLRHLLERAGYAVTPSATVEELVEQLERVGQAAPAVAVFGACPGEGELPDAADADAELANSARRLRAVTQLPLVALAYAPSAFLQAVLQRARVALLVRPLRFEQLQGCLDSIVHDPAPGAWQQRH
ncbi:MAG: hypothetical protein KC503_28145 [Myxococcales bacterium]|nr:hypothetical protein [Myxococcales bacterium]